MKKRTQGCPLSKSLNYMMILMHLIMLTGITLKGPLLLQVYHEYFEIQPKML